MEQLATLMNFSLGYGAVAAAAACVMLLCWNVPAIWTQITELVSCTWKWSPSTIT